MVTHQSYQGKGFPESCVTLLLLGMLIIYIILSYTHVAISYCIEQLHFHSNENTVYS